METEDLVLHYQKTRGCSIKRSHKTRALAKEAARDMNRKNRRNGINRTMRAYACRFCQEYHIGNMSK